jgi:paraquat-inducible protein A
MVAVFDKGNLLSVYPGIAATSFTVVVISTLFAAHCFDTRLIWDAQNHAEKQNNKIQGKKHND